MPCSISEGARRVPGLMVALCAAAICTTVRAAEDTGEELVRVNADIITRHELDIFTALNPTGFPSLGGTWPQALKQQREQAALRSLVDYHLLLQQAYKEYGGDDETWDDILDKLGEEEVATLRARAGSRVAVAAQVSEMGLSAEEYGRLRAEYRMVGHFLWDKVYSRVHVSPAEIQHYYRSHPEEFMLPPRLVYRQVLLPVLEDEEEAARAQAEGLLAELKGGADFGEVADRHSADRDRYPGGLHEVDLAADRPDWRPEAVAGLEPGELSPVREVAGNLTIARLEKVLPERRQPFVEAQAAVENLILAQKRKAVRGKLLDKLRGGARIEYLALPPSAPERGPG